MHLETSNPASVVASCPDEDQSQGMALYTSMFRMRAFEEKAHNLWRQGQIRGFLHLGVGQEAIPAGFAAAMRPDDTLVSTYRGHNHLISRGASLAAVMAELFGRAAGLCGGKGGTAHLVSTADGYYGSYAIVGAQLPIACGLAWSALLRKTEQVTICYFGDGTTNIGAFHEAINLAAVWKLPVVFVCENNQFMEYTAIGAVTAVSRPAADRASAYGLDTLLVDGNDVEAVLGVAEATIAKARSGQGPSLVEAVTYRHYGHSAADPAPYRSKEEVTAWKARDPIPTFRAVLEERGVSSSDLQRLEDEVAAEVNEATEQAQLAPLPDVSTASTDLWSDGGSTWRN